MPMNLKTFYYDSQSSVFRCVMEAVMSKAKCCPFSADKYCVNSVEFERRLYLSSVKILELFFLCCSVTHYCEADVCEETDKSLQSSVCLRFLPFCLYYMFFVTFYGTKHSIFKYAFCHVTIHCR